MLKLFTSIFIVFSLTSCEVLLDTILETPSSSSGGAAKQVLSEAQVARIFFQAYKNRDRRAAARVASPEAINKLEWDWDPPSNLRLEETDSGYAIAYDGGTILLDIFSDGHVGANVADVRLIAD